MVEASNPIANDWRPIVSACLDQISLIAKTPVKHREVAAQFVEKFLSKFGEYIIQWQTGLPDYADEGQSVFDLANKLVVMREIALSVFHGSLFSTI